MTIDTRSLLVTALLTIGLSTIADAAARAYDSRDVGDWMVAESKDGKGCFLTREYDRPGTTTLLLGLDADGTNHLSVLNANWSIKPRERLKLNFRLSNGAYPGHFAVGMAADDKQGFVSTFESKFPGYFAASQTLSISRGDVPVERLNLDGSGAAVSALRGCVARLVKASSLTGRRHADDIPRDPFARSRDRK